MNARHLLRRDFSSRLVTPAVKPAIDLRSFGGGGAGDQTHDRFRVTQRFATPVGRNEREQAVFDLVPFARPRRKVTNRNLRRTSGSDTMHEEIASPARVVNVIY
jgi:hypothetical protein